MKKIMAALVMAISTSAFAGGWASLDVDSVQGRDGAKDSTATYLRLGKDFGSTSMMLQGRTARFDGGGLVNSVEATVSNSRFGFGGVRPFVGFGYDHGYNGGKDFNYGLVGATYGRPVGPGFALLGAKTRVGSTQDGPRTKQTVTFATYSLPVTKEVSLNLNLSRSDQTIKENAVGLGFGVRF